MSQVLEVECQLIAALELEYLVAYLTKPGGDFEDDELSAREAIADYRRFLDLVKRERKKRQVPGRQVDKVWHAHILHTQRYHDDCQSVFGCYLHHAPRPATSSCRAEQATDSRDCNTADCFNNCACTEQKPHQPADCDAECDPGCDCNCM